MNNLIVGSAGWRMPYAGKKEILSIEEIKNLIRFIESNNYSSIDTAPSYADSESIILELARTITVSSKLNTFNDLEGCTRELNKINSEKVNVVYFHDENLVSKFSKRDINQFISLILDKSLIPGMSIYDIESMEETRKTLDFEIIYQVPLNIFDMKFLK